MVMYLKYGDKMQENVGVNFCRCSSQINTCFSSKLIFLSKNIAFLVKMQLQIELNMILVGKNVRNYRLKSDQNVL